MHLVFTGIQGCGKGTQARLLVEKHGYEIVEMGGELRKVVASGSELGQKIKEVIDAGYLVNAELGAEVMKQAIENYKEHENVIFDAFIRLEWNKVIFDKFLPDYKVVLFDLSEKNAMERLLGRMYNPQTGETFPYGIKTDPNTGDTLIQRDDDVNEASILKRIEEFKKHTLPLVDLQRKEGKVIDIDADQSIDEVFTDVEMMLNLK